MKIALVCSVLAAAILIAAVTVRKQWRPMVFGIATIAGAVAVAAWVIYLLR